MQDDIFKEMWTTIRANKTWRGFLENRKKDGSFYWVDAAITPILDENGNIVEYIAIRHEVTQIIQQRKELEIIATTTALTGYKNRFQLLKDISSSKNASLAILDMDNFSQINDFYGHSLGDSIIIQAANFIFSSVEHDSRYRFYHSQGDEFVILANGVEREAFINFIQALVEKIIAQAFLLDNESVHISITASISFEAPLMLLKTADMAMRLAKKDKKELIVYSSNLGLEKIYENNLLWAHKIQKALILDTIIPFFQPIYDNHQQTVVKYEALVRLIDDGVAISPFFFLEVAKKTKQYNAITKIMIQKSFEVISKNKYEVSINLTIEDILNKEIQIYIFEMLEQYGNGHRVIFEIVESEGILNFKEVMYFIASIKRYGCRIAIDDFGTGYSNFEYLLKLKVDFIKIDGSLIKGLLTENGSEYIVGIIVDFAQKIGIKTIAEFVENEALQTKVKAMGIDFSQGYFHGKPRESLIIDDI